jgi:hypothetical protein
MNDRVAVRTDLLSTTNAWKSAFLETITLPTAGCIVVIVSSEHTVTNTNNNSNFGSLWDVMIQFPNGSWYSSNGPEYHHPSFSDRWETYTSKHWMDGPLPAGTYKVDVLFKNQDTGDTARVYWRTLDILTTKQY